MPSTRPNPTSNRNTSTGQGSPWGITIGRSPSRKSPIEPYSLHSAEYQAKCGSSSDGSKVTKSRNPPSPLAAAPLSPKGIAEHDPGGGFWTWSLGKSTFLISVQTSLLVGPSSSCAMLAATGPETH